MSSGQRAASSEHRPTPPSCLPQIYSPPATRASPLLTTVHLRLALRLPAALALALTGLVAATAPDPAGVAGNVPVQYWSLPTGSRIAYVHVPATGGSGRPPVVFVHGGPGACEVYAYTFAHPWYERLARQGFDVYLYDQIGSGLSARLPDPRDYTMGRHLADLEAIRRAIGCDRLILIGESHGALEPAERKQQIYPCGSPRVAREMLHWIRETRGEGFDRWARLDSLLQSGDIAAAHAFAGDAEMDALMSAWVQERILPTCVHDPARLRARQFAIPGMGWWAGLMTTWDGVAHRRDVRRRLASCDVPVLILRGDSDYLPADIADEYATTMPRAKLIRVPAAGHFIWMDRPEIYRGEIEAFLGDATRSERP